jgi:branched-chain amino acid transport system ATP-binding protein
VEQDLGRAMGVADRVVCMLEGRIVLEGTPSDLTREQVTEAYFGLRRQGATA